MTPADAPGDAATAEGDDEEPPIVLVVDAHEPVDVYERLVARGVPVERRKIHPADYVVGPIGVERKSVGDFFSSLTQKRLFEQVVRLKETYPQPVLLLEGDLTRVATEFAQPTTFWGALASIAVDVGVPVLPAPSKDETALLLERLHARVVRGAARGEGVRTDVRFKPRMIGPAAEQKFAVQGLPGIGDIASERLLERFGTVRRVYAATEREFTRVPGLGKVKARQIHELLDRPFEGAQKRLPGKPEPDES